MPKLASPSSKADLFFLSGKWILVPNRLWRLLEILLPIYTLKFFFFKNIPIKSQTIKTCLKLNSLWSSTSPSSYLPEVTKVISVFPFLVNIESYCTYYSALGLFVTGMWWISLLQGSTGIIFQVKCAPEFIHQTICFQILFFCHHKECVKKYVHVLDKTRNRFL